ncbi:predicted protein [Streptomyces viridochromogenes DSM 40736]|uniref:Predicted protein n=1 Tax=Streptomyces viridochromogenes (strain DSM 40736 / JCM 4977 / BCRC 1201 / Tue 494) TaxID=591159 RepID=D9X364_STRVT|nr:hypothetical protein [Streptomyces viridochromogenes]EFL29580.1 predicted protein [Streptomyces viridochromogenes DSM 40736]
MPIATDPASDLIWDSGPLPYTAFETDNIQRSVLTHHWGLQLYVMPRLHRPGEYLALPMLPANTSHQHVTGLKAPRGIAVPADPVRAAALLHRRLLTEYRLSAPTPIRRSSPGHLQVHVTLDECRRPRIPLNVADMFAMTPALLRSTRSGVLVGASCDQQTPER